jgi:hypothetical protein
VRYGQCAGHHRGLRAGQVFRGGTRELGRAIGLLDAHPGTGDRGTKSPGTVWALRPGTEPYGETTNSEKHARDQGTSAKAKEPERARWQS